LPLGSCRQFLLSEERQLQAPRVLVLNVFAGMASPANRVKTLLAAVCPRDSMDGGEMTEREIIAGQFPLSLSITAG
jgi:hypothetical protein